MKQVTQTHHHNRAISTGKAICIILMVIGHSGCPQLLRDWLYTFHMPFFFFVSGYLFSDRSLDTFIPFVKRKFKGLWWPFVKWNVIFILLHNLFYKLGFENGDYSLIDVAQKVGASFYMGDPELLLGTFWFLQQLIRVSIIAWIILKACKYLSIYLSGIPYRILILFVNLLVAILALVSFWVDFRISGVISKLTIISLLFYLSGYTFCHWIPMIGKACASSWMLALSLVMTILGAIFNPAEMLTVKTNGVLPYWIVGLFGCVLVLNVSERLKSFEYTNRLDNIGKRTLIVMVWHFLMFKFLSLLLVRLDVISPEGLLAWPVPSITKEGWWMLYSVIGVVFPLIIDAILRKIKEVFCILFPKTLQTK